MKYPHRFVSWLFVFLFTLIFVGCAVQTKNRKNKLGKMPAKKVSQQLDKPGFMKVAFVYPVIKVNGQSATPGKESGEYQNRVELSYPQNSVQDIVLTLAGSDGNQYNLYGKIKIFKYTKYSKPTGEQGSTVLIAPENSEYEDSEYLYSSILHNGYGELTITETVHDPVKGEIKGPVLAQLILGSKKKNNNSIEFRFRKNSFDTVQGKKLPVSFFFKENSQHEFDLTMDSGAIKIQGNMAVYSGNSYTAMAPIWIDLNEKSISYLQARGGKVTLALYVPSTKFQNQEKIFTSVAPGENPASVAKKHGMMVAVLKLRRIE